MCHMMPIKLAQPTDIQVYTKIRDDIVQSSGDFTCHMEYFRL